jgi:hypothetical protein
MTIGDYIQAKLKRFNFSMSAEELEAFLVDQEMTASSQYTKELSNKTKIVMVAIIPELLLAPEIKQGDFSIKYNVDGIKTYYSMLCGQTGLPDIFNPVDDTVQDRSDIW